MLIRTLAAIICSFALLFALSGCGSSCSTACSKIYDECEFTIDELSQDECVKECDDSDDKEKDDTIDCVMKTSCSDLAMGECYY